jgi:ATP-dependent exoDNAse (exonuclease V) alpha subunit
MPDPADPRCTGDPEAYARNRPLDADLIVVDESSMLDLLLANELVGLSAIRRLSNRPRHPGRHP